MFKPFEIEKLNMYQLLVTACAPRPIAWVATLNEDGSVNIAPFSFMMVVGASPTKPMIAFCPLNPKSGKGIKDTLRNIMRTGEFTYNVVTLENMHLANKSSVELPYGQSEADYVGIELVQSLEIKTPRILVSPVQFECRLPKKNGIVRMGDEPLDGTIISGVIVKVHIQQNILQSDGITIDPKLLRLVGRMGGDSWTETSAFPMVNERVPK